MPAKTFAYTAFISLISTLLITGCGGTSIDTEMLAEQQSSETETEESAPPSPTNSAPVVVINGAADALAESNFILDGSASHDADGTIQSWSWSQLATGAPIATISNATTQVASITAPSTDEPVDLVFRLTVTDDKGASAGRNFTVSITPVFVFTPCNADDVSTFSTSGVYSSPQHISDVIALCDGEILLGNTGNNRIEYVDLKAGTVTVYYELTAAPDDLEYDPQRSLVYASMKGSTSVARVDLTSGLVDYIPVSGVPSAIAARYGNGVYMISPGTTNSLYWYDADDVEHGPYPVTGDMIQFNQTLNQVITAQRGISPTTLYVYDFDDNGDIELVDSRGSLGGNSQTLKISPDDAHLVVVAGGGNAEGYGITDLSPSDLSSSFGEFTTGAYPTGGDFSADSSRFATSNNSSFLIYQVSSHAELFSATPPTTGCPYYDLDAAFISRGGQLGIALQRCGFESDSTNLHWYKLP